MKQYLLIFIALNLLACAPEKTSSTYSKKTLTLSDSITLTKQAFPRLIKVTNNTFLFYDIYSQDIAFLNSQGDTLHHFNKSGDGEESYQMVRGVSQLPNGRLLLYSTFHYYLYQPDGSFVKKGNIGPQGTMANPNIGFKAPFYVDNKGTPYLVFPGGYPPNHPVFYPEYVKDFPLASTVNLNDESFYTAAKLPEGTMFHQTYFAKNLPILDVYADRLFVKMPYGHEVYVYRLPNLEYLKSLKISEEEVLTGVKYGQAREEMGQKAFLNQQQQVIYNKIVATGPESCWLERTEALPESIPPAKNTDDYRTKGLKQQRKKTLVHFQNGESQFYHIPKSISLSDYNSQQGLVLSGQVDEVNNTLSLYFAIIN